MQPEALMTPFDYLKILKRRKWSLLLPAVCIILLALVIAFSLPAIYRSEATILIEAQEVPADFVASTVTSYVEQRLQTLQQQIMSFTPLLQIIQDYNLYPGLKDKVTSEEIVERMRSDTTLTPVSTDVVDRRTGRPTAAMIAFTLSFQGKDPQKVQRVTNVLTSLYLQKNLEERVHQVSETSAFLENELTRVKSELVAVEAEIADFKQQNMQQLPEMLQVNMQSLNNTQRSIESANQQMRTLKERESYLDAQLVSVEPYLDNEEETIGRKRLEELKIQLVALTKRFADAYPDVKKTRAEIAELEARLKSGGTAELGAPDNPAYITLKAQLASVRTEIKSIQQQIRTLEAEAADYQQRILATPNVEKAYSQLLISRQSNQAKYNDLMSKLMEAKTAHGLESEQKGERFTLVEAPRLPQKPYKPNRLAIVLIGIVLGLGTGVGLAALIEFSDDRIYSADALRQATNFRVLTRVPIILTQKDVVRLRIKRLALTGTAMLLIGLSLAVVHYLVMDLDLVWLKVLRRVGI